MYQENLMQNPESTSVIVNTKKMELTVDSLTFHQVIKLAYSNPLTGPDIHYTVNYRRGRGQQEMSMVEGSSVDISDGMVFNVGITDKT